MECTLSIRHEPKRWNIAVTGELDAASLPSLDAVLASLPPAEHVVVDLRRTTFVGVQPLGWLVATQRERAEEGGSLQVRAPSAHLLSVAALLGYQLDVFDA